MELHTRRLTLNELSLNELDVIHQLHSLPETDEFNTLGIPADKMQTKMLLDEWVIEQAAPRKSYIYCITLVETGAFIGLIALKLGKSNYRNAEVWYKVHPDYWRQGFTTEALSKLLHFAFNDLSLHRIEAGCAVENIASIKVLEKVGMIREGRKRKILPIRGSWIDNFQYAILDTDFFNSVKLG